MIREMEEYRHTENLSKNPSENSSKNPSEKPGENHTETLVKT